MRKKEIIWISRDNDGLYMQWRTKPQWRLSKEYTGENYISGSASLHFPLFSFAIKRGGLAKITIERQY